MKNFKRPPTYCNVCGRPFDTEVRTLDGPYFFRNQSLCSRLCFLEAEWRWTLLVLQKDYYARPKEKTDGV